MTGEPKKKSSRSQTTLCISRPIQRPTAKNTQKSNSERLGIFIFPMVAPFIHYRALHTAFAIDTRTQRYVSKKHENTQKIRQAQLLIPQLKTVCNSPFPVRDEGGSIHSLLQRQSTT